MKITTTAIRSCTYTIRTAATAAIVAAAVTNHTPRNGANTGRTAAIERKCDRK